MVIEDRDISSLVKVEKYLMLLMIEFKKRKADTITPREEGEKEDHLFYKTYVRPFSSIRRQRIFT